MIAVQGAGCNTVLKTGGGPIDKYLVPDVPVIGPDNPVFENRGVCLAVAVVRYLCFLPR